MHSKGKNYGFTNLLAAGVTWNDIVRIMRFVSKISDIYDFAHKCTSDRIIYVYYI